MPSLATRLAVATVLAGINFAAIQPAEAQQVNPNITAGVGTNNVGGLKTNTDIGCRVNARACSLPPSGQQRDPAPPRGDRNGGGPRPGRR